MAAAAIGATMVALVGCSSTASTTDGKPALTQFYHQYGEAGVEEAVKEYGANYADASVTVEWVEGDYNQKINALLLAGQGIDVYENNQIDVASARQGLYADLTDIVEAVADEMAPISLKPVAIDGKYYGIPMITDAQLFLYRPSMFEAAGVEVPTTWDELVEVAKKLTTEDHKGLFLGNDGGVGVLAYNMPPATGSGLLNEDNTEVTFNTPALAEGMATAAELYNSGALLMGAPTDWWDPTSFIAGDAAITWQGLWAVPAIVDALGDDVGAFALPAVGSDGTGAVAVSQWNMQVAASSANIEAAKALVKAQWIDDIEWQKTFNVGFGFHIPPITATAASTPELQDGIAKQIVDLTGQYGYSPGPFWTPGMGTALTDAVSRILLEGADPATELSAAADTAQSLLDELNK